eukprot:814516-Rhodomonas_salina.1
MTYLESREVCERAMMEAVLSTSHRRDGQTALHYAAAKGNSEAAKVLLEAGVDKEAKEKVSINP